MDSYQDATDLVRSLNPEYPVLCNRPAAAKRAAEWFCERFAGSSFYAVKANPSPWIIQALAAGGICDFDVASIKEARLVRSLLPHARLGFMHPVKPRQAIAEAYHDLGVRIFSLDSQAELEKIVEATGGARDLTLCVRLAVPGGQSKISLAAKFGARGDKAAELMRNTRQVAERLGACFHVGSQTMSPSAYRDALEAVQQTVVAAGVIVDVLDVGGGFPAIYPDMSPPPLDIYIGEIERFFEQTMLVPENCELWCEPGRALAAEAASLVTRVEQRADDTLYINDGVFGTLFDAGPLGWRYPVRQLGAGQQGSELRPFSFYGPTCDDYDHMQGPFFLPDSIGAGDYIEIGMLGAYGAAMRTDFNGFANHLEVEVTDLPMHTQYGNVELPAVLAR